MARFEDHISQAKSNIVFLEHINASLPNHLDWQVTCCFYISLHLINAHLAKSNIHFTTHNKVNNTINPYEPMAVAKIPTDPYLAYEKLSNLSRRSRYLINPDNVEELEVCHLTYSKHLAKALRHLNTIITWFKAAYGDNDLGPINIKCIELSKAEKLTHITII